MNKAERAERNAKIVEAYERGDHVSSIAERTNVSIGVVYSVIQNARTQGSVTRTQRSSHVDPAERKRRAQEFASLYQEGMSLQRIGKMHGITGEAVRRVMIQGGVELPEKRSAAYYSSLRYDEFVKTHGDAIAAAFDETRNVGAVISRFPDISSILIRRFLSPKSKASIQTRPSRVLWTKEQMLDLLKFAAGDRDHLSTGDYDKWRNSGAMFEGKVPPTKIVICWRFGTWNDAIIEAGLRAASPKRRVYTRSWNRDDALNAVRTYAREALANGERPTSSGYEKWSPSRDGVPSRATLGYASGGMTWSEMLREAYARLDGEA